MMAGMKTIFDISNEIWEDDVSEYCKHEECPYKGGIRVWIGVIGNIIVCLLIIILGI